MCSNLLSIFPNVNSFQQKQIYFQFLPHPLVITLDRFTYFICLIYIESLNKSAPTVVKNFVLFPFFIHDVTFLMMLWKNLSIFVQKCLNSKVSNTEGFRKICNSDEKFEKYNAEYQNYLISRLQIRQGKKAISRDLVQKRMRK